jgi:hypothetical protein
VDLAKDLVAVGALCSIKNYEGMSAVDVGDFYESEYVRSWWDSIYLKAVPIHRKICEIRSAADRVSFSLNARGLNSLHSFLQGPESVDDLITGFEKLRVIEVYGISHFEKAVALYL